MLRLSRAATLVVGRRWLGPHVRRASVCTGGHEWGRKTSWHAQELRAVRWPGVPRRMGGMRYYSDMQAETENRRVRVTHGWDVKELEVKATCTVAELLEKLALHWEVDATAATIYESRSKRKLDSSSGSLFEEGEQQGSTEPYQLLLLAPAPAHDPEDSFEDRMWLFCTTTDSIQTIAERVAVEKGIEARASSAKVRKRLAKHLYPALLAFSRRGQELLSEETRTALRSGRMTVKDIDQVLMESFLKFYKEALPEKREHLLDVLGCENEVLSTDEGLAKDTALSLASMRNPHTWYPLARSEKRKVILHVGPTNSGKTHGALETLKSAQSGVYLGPLRLLAHEVFDRLNQAGVPTSLVTGQLRKEIEGAQHKSCTVEMADINTRVESAVLDEIQMISDPDRGWAWARALLGVPCLTFHVCGSASAVMLVKELCERAGDEVEVVEFKRLSPLEQTPRPLETVYDIEKGDCIVAFSRRDLYDIKYQVERELGKRCCLIYGGLPPETRNQQAALFNDPESGFDVLVASDAVGMGLNLNIKRVLFSTTNKFDGTSRRALEPSEVKQIAGRAGRFGSEFPHGYVSSFTTADHKCIRRGLRLSDKPIEYAGLHPDFEQIEMFTLTQAGKPFSRVLLQFAKLAELDNEFFLCNFETLVELARMTDDLPLTLKERYTFCTAPVDTNNMTARHWFRQYAEAYSEMAGDIEVKKQGVPIGVQAREIPDGSPIATKERLQEQETIHHILDFYLWLGYRFKDTFTNVEAAEKQREACYTAIETALENMATLGMTDFAKLQRRRQKKRTRSRRSGH